MKDTAAAFRAAFDRSFSEPEPAPASARIRLLTVRARDRSIAIRLDAITGVLRCPEITPVPSDARALLGVAGVRGEIISLFCLAALMGGTEPCGGSWAALYGQDRAVGLAFDAIEATVEVAAEELREVVRVDRASYSVMNAERIAQLLAPHRG